MNSPSDSPNPTLGTRAPWQKTLQLFAKDTQYNYISIGKHHHTPCPDDTAIHLIWLMTIRCFPDLYTLEVSLYHTWLHLHTTPVDGKTTHRRQPCKATLSGNRLTGYSACCPNARCVYRIFLNS